MTPQSESIRVLHVDNEADFAEMVATFLEREDERFTVETATSASEGLDRLASGGVDCVVSDYDMPERTGIEFLESVREDYPDLPFILFTGKGSEDVASEAISAGVTDYFEKEAGTDQYGLLANRIDNAVEGYRAERRAAKSNRRYSALFEHTTDAIAWIEFDGRTPIIRDANARFEELFAPEGGSVLGRDLDDVVTGDDRHEDARAITDRVRGGESISLTLSRQTVDGERDFRCQAVPVTDPETGDVGYGFAVYSDVTDDTDGRRLERHRHRFSATFEAIPEPIAHVRFEDGHPIVQTVNSAFTETFGYDRGEIKGKSINEAIVPEDRMEQAREIDRTRQVEDEIEREVVREAADGRRTFLFRSKRFDPPEGPRESIAVYTDITDRKEREQELRAERDRYTTLFDNLPSPVVYGHMGEDGEAIVRDVNPAFEETFGYEADAIEGESLHDFVLPDDRDEVIATADGPGTDLETINRRLRDQGRVHADVRRATTDGVREFRLDIAMRTSETGPTEGYTIYSDITERKRRERALEHLNEATREMMTADTADEVATIGSETATQVLGLPTNSVHLYDPEEDALMPAAWADRAAALIGGSPPPLPVEGSLAGRTYRTGEPEVYTDVREADEVFNPDTPFRSELHLPLGDHGVLVAGSTTVDDFDATEEALARILAANIEAALDRVEQREALQRERDRLDEFASVVSHDLQNPLNVARGRLRMAREECDSDHFENIERAHDRMESMIDDLLTLAREGDRVEEPEAVDLPEMADTCWQHTDTETATLSVETERTIRADPGRLKQLFENLFRNAVEHGDEDVTVTIGCVEDGDEVEGLFVADDGPGIPPGKRDRVFEAGHSTTREGTGFGLNIVQEIASAHGWEVSITDSEDGGARFEITGVDVVE